MAREVRYQLRENPQAKNAQSEPLAAIGAHPQRFEANRSPSSAQTQNPAIR